MFHPQVFGVIEDRATATSNLFRKQVLHMLGWAILFLIIAIVAGIFGFFGIVSAAVGIAKILFVIFLIMFVVSLFVRRRRSY